MLPAGKALLVQLVDLLSVFVLVRNRLNAAGVFLVYPLDVPLHAVNVVVGREVAQRTFEDALPFQMSMVHVALPIGLGDQRVADLAVMPLTGSASGVRTHQFHRSIGEAATLQVSDLVGVPLQVALWLRTL